MGSCDACDSTARSGDFVEVFDDWVPDETCDFTKFCFERVRVEGDGFQAVHIREFFM